ncbi:DUF692 domain-containing protein [Marinagarivorans cellulosilyticus]|uniref:DUF692 domain-containing protein n=1 Tax=Marinagarivorans cellulosilyticus TaxID=2721545 RepID=A0AAN2BJ09_9GAMM|nr:DUF692 domain-containing protein [Marinagarivorans cellulosilyticus]BCD96483.1 hypothetical protein MARGE09_P0683 [Marinagarivorans cellulosilyticus]
MQFHKAARNAASSPAFVGVGLRHPHFSDALNGVAADAGQLDFIEIHTENFFAQGGPLIPLIDELAAKYAISLHGTSLGLGSACGIPKAYLSALASLNDRVRPIMLSDHASFSWGEIERQSVHAGDLLPLEFGPEGLEVIANNVDEVQQHLGRQLLVENISRYLPLVNAQMSEQEFLSILVDKTQCGLLIDLNNVLINAHNFEEGNALSNAQSWLEKIPKQAVKELHLAGYTPAQKEYFIVDDHSRAISDECWQLFDYALERFGAVPTLIEWDNDLPEWQVLLAEAKKATLKIETKFSKAVLNG